MVSRRTEQRVVHRDAPQEQVQIVVEGDADAAMELYAVLQELDAVLSDERLRRAVLRGLG